MPIVEPEVDIHCPEKAKAEALLKVNHPRQAKQNCQTVL